jgi:putative endonuclease
MVFVGVPQRWWLYLLACRDGRMYAGIAIDVEARLAAHACGKGAKFTRANPPLALLGAQPFETRSQALKAEHALKRLRPAAKLEWARRWPASCEGRPPAGRQGGA